MARLRAGPWRPLAAMAALYCRAASSKLPASSRCTAIIIIYNDLYL